MMQLSGVSVRVEPRNTMNQLVPQPLLRDHTQGQLVQRRTVHGRRPDSISLLQRCWVVDGKQPSGKTKALYDSAVQKLLDEVGFSLLDAANKSEWHNITRPEALAEHSGSHGIQVSSPSCRQTALCCHQRGCIIHITSSQLAPR
jgi:hypothetical protein